MILATKRKNVTQPDTKIMAQIQALKEMYGIKTDFGIVITRPVADRKYWLQMLGR